MNDDLMHIADGLQSIVLRRPGSDFEREIPKTLVRRFRSRRHFRVSETVVPMKSAHWYFSQNDLDVEPLEGDEIEDQTGHRWTILEVNRSDLNGTWQCVARMYAVHFGLDEYVDHLRPAFTKTPAGTLQRGYRVLETGIAAKFSTAEQAVEGVWKESLYALIQEAIDVETDDALRRADGSVYRIKKLQQPLYSSGWTEIELHNV